MNSVNLMGRITSDPELRSTQGGVASCRFTIAVNRPFKNKQTGEFEADFITCIAWRNTAEFIARYFNKGRMIAVTGELRTGSYKDKNHSDVTHYTTDVNVEQAFFCGDKGNNNNAAAYPPNEAQPSESNETGMDYGTDLSDFEEILDGDVPF